MRYETSLCPSIELGVVAMRQMMLRLCLCRASFEVLPLPTTYRTRWNVEPYHKSLKQNASLEKSPTQVVVTQTNHFFASLCAYVKLEMLRGSPKLNHFAMKMKLYTEALQVAFTALRQLQPVQLAA